ncbi:hypothetical protein EC950943_4121A, partial [Escherichia coli 95.0943]
MYSTQEPLTHDE